MKSHKRKSKECQRISGDNDDEIVGHQTAHTAADFRLATDQKKNRKISGPGDSRRVYVRACTGHVPGAMYLDESHGNSARACTCTYVFTRTHVRLHARVARASVCVIVCAVSLLV